MHENIPPDSKIEANKIETSLCQIAGITPNTAPNIPPDMAPHLKPYFIVCICKWTASHSFYLCSCLICFLSLIDKLTWLIDYASDK